MPWWLWLILGFLIGFAAVLAWAMMAMAKEGDEQALRDRKRLP